MVVQTFSKIQDSHTQANLCRIFFNLATIKTDNEAIARIKYFARYDVNGTNNLIKLKTDDIVEYKTCWTVPLCSCFLSIKLKVFHVTQNETPKMANVVCLY